MFDFTKHQNLAKLFTAALAAATLSGCLRGPTLDDTAATYELPQQTVLMVKACANIQEHAYGTHGPNAFLSKIKLDIPSIKQNISEKTAAEFWANPLSCASLIKGDYAEILAKVDQLNPDFTGILLRASHVTASKDVERLLYDMGDIATASNQPSQEAISLFDNALSTLQAREALGEVSLKGVKVGDGEPATEFALRMQSIIHNYEAQKAYESVRGQLGSVESVTMTSPSIG